MSQQALVLEYFVDALLNHANQKPAAFTVNAWLLLQLSLDELPGNVQDRDLLFKSPKSGIAAYEKLNLEVERILTDAKKDWYNPDKIDDRVEILETSEKHILQAIEAYFPYLFIPDDWKLHWMGVEG